jgi:hypothetical protein
MTSPVGVVPPLLLPRTDGYADYQADVTVSPATDPDAVEVAVPSDAQQPPPDAPQTLADETGLPLATIIAPHAGTARYLPVGELLTDDAWPAPAGPFSGNAWVFDAIGEKSPLPPLLPPEIPAPAYWVLEGVDPLSVDDPDNPGSGLLDRWLSGAVPEVTPQTEKAATADQTWKQRMLAGTWAEPVQAGTALGLAATDGTLRRLRIWAFDADGTPLPAAGVLAAFGTVDPTLLPTHPVVVGSAGLAASLPVRFYLRFDLWDVTQSSAYDLKGSPQSLPPSDVQLIDSSGAPIPGTSWTWRDPATGGVLEVPQANVALKTFSIRATFPVTQPIQLSRTEQRFQPAGQPLDWNTKGWKAQDGTDGDWTSFSGLLIGSATRPAVFWIGTQVRLAARYEQPRINWFDRSKSLTAGGTYTVTKLDTRPVAAGHVITLYQPGKDPETFVTDDDGEVSGVSLTIVPGSDVTVGLSTYVNIPDLYGSNSPHRIEANDDSTNPLLGDMVFHADKARTPLSFPVFVAGGISASVGPATFVADADMNNFSVGNSAFAAVFHALKCMKLTHDAVALLQSNSVGLPGRHLIMLRSGVPDGPVTSPRQDTGPSFSAETGSVLPDVTSWFCSNVMCHEYGHAIACWLGGVTTTQARYDAYVKAFQASSARQLSERGVTGHSAGVISNSGVALDEGLAEFIECLMGYLGDFHGGNTTLSLVAAPSGTLPRDLYNAQVPGGTPKPLRDLTPADVRGVEGVVALALCGYFLDVTGFPGFPIDTGSSVNRLRPAKAYYDEWVATLPPSDQLAAQQRLVRLFRWLTGDALNAMYGDNPANWTGYWAPSVAHYPTVEDYLTKLKRIDPDLGQHHYHQESYAYLDKSYLVPWNLES